MKENGKIFNNNKYLIGLKILKNVKEEEFKYGWMVHVMKGIGLRTKQMDLEDLYMLMEMCMKENGKMIKHMDKEFTHMLMDLDMKVPGLKINSMDME